MPKRSGEPPLYRRADSPYWWTWTYDGGRRRKVSTKCTDRRAALARAAELQRQGASPAGPGAEATVEDALLAFVAEPGARSRLTIASYDQHAARLATVLGSVRLADLTADDIRHYLDARRAAKATMRVELAVLWAALKSARRRGWPAPAKELLEVPIPGTTQRKDRWLTDVELGALCEQLLGYRADWIRVACWTGTRKEELNALDWSDVDMEQRAVRIRGTKGKRDTGNASDRLIPIGSSFMAWRLQARPVKSGPVVRRWPNPWVTIARACTRAGIRHCSSHDFRRTFASKLKQRGVDSMVVAKLLGHTTSRLVDTVYGHLDLGALRGAMELL